MRVYISGPMSGLPDLNFPAFNAAADKLRAAGFDVVNPVDVNPDPNTPYAQCMRNDIGALLTCQAVAKLPDWNKSRGASVEVAVAVVTGMHIDVVDGLIAAAPSLLGSDAQAFPPAPASTGAGVASLTTD